MGSTNLYRPVKTGAHYELDMNHNFICLHPFDMQAKVEESRQNDDEFHGGFFTLRDLLNFLEFHGMGLNDLRGWTPPAKGDK